MPIKPDELATRFPCLYHMAHQDSWPSIKRHGLLSTSALLDLFEMEGEDRRAIESRHRPSSISITHPVHGTAVVRDQKPMSDDALRKCLKDDLTPYEWYQILNKKVFFWPAKHRLESMLGAAAYSEQRHLVLTIDTQKLLTAHSDRTVLSPINSGSTLFRPSPRGLDTFLPLDDYPFLERKKKRGIKDAVAELAVRYRVPDISKFVVRVEKRGAGRPPVVIEEL